MFTKQVDEYEKKDIWLKCRTALQ